MTLPVVDLRDLTSITALDWEGDEVSCLSPASSARDWHNLPAYSLAIVLEVSCIGQADDRADLSYPGHRQ